ncbi:MAG: hypothetical protein ABI431_05915 [Candidatus Tumulicola sp.]
MIGSSAAALTGLMFVVITLVNNEQRKRNPNGIATFSTPTVLHFCAALFVAAIVSAPWRSLTWVAAFIAAFGAYGSIFSIYVMYRARRLHEYRADIEDWTWFVVLPILAYVAMFGAGLGLLWKPAQFLFVLGGATVFLIFIGIRNAWDVVTFLAVNGDPSGKASGDD